MTAPAITPAPSEWMTTSEAAEIFEVSVGKARWVCKLGLTGFTRRSDTGRWLIHRSAVDSPQFWALITGTANRKSWGEAWKGERISHRMEVRQLRQAAGPGSSLRPGLAARHARRSPATRPTRL